MKGRTEVLVQGTGFLRSSSLTWSVLNTMEVKSQQRRGLMIRASFVYHHHYPGALTRSHEKRRLGAAPWRASRGLEPRTARELFYLAQIEFVYDALLTIQEAYPPSGPASGNFSVVVRVAPLPDSELLRCRFGIASSTLRD